MVNKPLIRPYSWGGVALGGVARIPLIFAKPPLVVGNTSPTAFAAPVAEGMMLQDAARPPRQSWRLILWRVDHQPLLPNAINPQEIKGLLARLRETNG